MNRPFEIDGEYFIFLNESPDVITVGSEHGPQKQLFTWRTGADAYPFGYFNGKMVIGQEGRMHSDTIANDRNRMKYPGRIWTRKKVISFWVYPPLSELKKVIKDLNHTFNNVPLTNGGDDDLKNLSPQFIPRVKSRGDDYGKINIDGSWKLDIPSETGLSYNDFARTNSKAIAQKYFDSRGYLYNIKTVFSGKPLKGAGEKLKKGEDVSTQGVDHVKPAMLKKNAMNKMSDKQKTDLYNYFKDKGRLSPAEERMYKMIHREGIDIYFDGTRFLFEESNKKYFTLEEGTGILYEE